MMRPRVASVLFGLAMILAAAFVMSVVFGSTRLPLRRAVEILASPSTEADPEALVVWSIRMKCHRVENHLIWPSSRSAARLEDRFSSRAEPAATRRHIR